MATESSKRFRMIQEGWFSGDTKVLRGDVLVARFSFGSWKTQGKISFDDVNYEVVRPKGLGTLLRLQRDGVAVCETRIGGMWSTASRVETGRRAIPGDLAGLRREDGSETGMMSKSDSWASGERGRARRREFSWKTCRQRCVCL